MKRTFSIILAFAAMMFAGHTAALAQSGTGSKKNFGYSQNPKTKPTPDRTVQSESSRIESAAVTPPKKGPEPPAQVAMNDVSIAEKTRNVAKNAARRSLPPTESYFIGAGDVLFISLQNNPKASTYFTVLNDGTIDYGLAGEMVMVAGLSTEEAEELIAGKIKLYENPQVSVKVREFNSHKVKVSGLVENPGDRAIQREAVPLFVIRADAVVKQGADRVSVKRSSGNIERFELKDQQWENVLVFAGDIIEFEATNGETRIGSEFVFVSGEVTNSGKFAYNKGLTLTQAITVAGGARRDGIKKTVVRRRNAAGLLESFEFNLKSIIDGKSPDPVLVAGDVIQVGN